MTYFETELSKVFFYVKAVAYVRFVGNCAYGKINDYLRLKVQFKTAIAADNYTHLSIKAINAKEGTVDEIVLRMSDVLGKNPKNGGSKYIMVCDGTPGWSYKATANDYKLLAEAVTTFVKVYK